MPFHCPSDKLRTGKELPGQAPLRTHHRDVNALGYQGEVGGSVVVKRAAMEVGKVGYLGLTGGVPNIRKK